MPFGSLGIWEVLLILLVLLLVFGARRLPELGGALGKGIREFKKSVRDIEAELNQPVDGNSGEIASGQRPAQPNQTQQPQQAQQAQQPPQSNQPPQSTSGGGAERAEDAETKAS